MASVNKVILLGTLGRDPETRHTPDGIAVTSFSIATNESWKDKNGQKQERTEWHNIVTYRKLAEIAGQYLKKGSQVYIEGSLSTRKWQDKSGADRYTTEVRCSEMQMIGGRGNANSDSFGSSAPQRQAQSQKPAPSNTGGNTGYSNDAGDEWSDEIPFISPLMAQDFTIRKLNRRRRP